jgi:hypothetical protein
VRGRRRTAAAADGPAGPDMPHDGPSTGR